MTKTTIRFKTDKNGKRRAHYWGMACRWLPISIGSAELKLATGEAILLDDILLEATTASADKR